MTQEFNGRRANKPTLHFGEYNNHHNESKIDKALSKINKHKYASDNDFFIFCISVFFDERPDIENESSNNKRILDNLLQALHQRGGGTDFLKEAVAPHFALGTEISDDVIFSSLINEYERVKIDRACFEWIDHKDIRQLLFIQSSLMYLNVEYKYNIKELSLGFLRLSPDDAPSSTISQLRIDQLHTSNSPKKILNLINYFFACCNANTQSKIEAIEQIKKAWNRASLQNKFMIWANKQNKSKLIDWLLSQEVINDINYSWLFKQNPRSLIDIFSIYFDLLSGYKPDTATVRLERLKKAWSQAKSREKNKENIQYNFILPPDIKDLLNEICETTGVSRNKLVEMAIKNEYKRFKDVTKEGS